MDNYTEPPVKHGTEDKPHSENLDSAMVTRSGVAAQPGPARPGYIDPSSPQSAGGLSLSFYAAAQSHPVSSPTVGYLILTPILINMINREGPYQCPLTWSLHVKMGHLSTKPYPTAGLVSKDA